MKKDKKITFTASSVMAFRLCQKMVTLALGKVYDIQQISFRFGQREGQKMSERLSVTAHLTIANNEWHYRKENPEFAASFDLLRYGDKWGICSTLPIVLDSRSGYEDEFNLGYTEFYTDTLHGLVISKPFADYPKIFTRGLAEYLQECMKGETDSPWRPSDIAEIAPSLFAVWKNMGSNTKGEWDFFFDSTLWEVRRSVANSKEIKPSRLTEEFASFAERKNLGFVPSVVTLSKSLEDVVRFANTFLWQRFQLQGWPQLPSSFKSQRLFKLNPSVLEKLKNNELMK